MLVSWTWLSRYINLDVTPSELADSLSLSGLNHEETFTRDGDVVIDLEVTSNRGDCLGHLGVAREIGVLYDKQLCIPNPQPIASGPSIDGLATVRNDFLEACPRYTARVVRGVQVQASPDWLADSLRSVGINPVNNIVDITNYVMMECGQPLHAFDLSDLVGPEVRVRPAAKGEQLEAIDHRTYPLDPAMCVIADAERAVAIAGVMGGATAEVGAATTDILMEAAVFAPLSVRRTARKLKLHSPSSFRFERRVDPRGVDWASRRACQMVLELAGGELATGVLDTAPEIPMRSPVPLRLSQIQRVLGISVDRHEVLRILVALGCQVDSGAVERLSVAPPSWRHDLSREADLIEEVARIHGYDKIPENSPIPVAPSARRDFDHAVDRLRHVLTAAGISEAMTPSVVTAPLDSLLSPWTDRPALGTQTPLLKGADRLRRSLLPSLLQSRADNWAAASIHADLFEVAHVYLPGETPNDLPVEQYNVGWVTGRDFYAAKGIVEILLTRLGIDQPLRVTAVAAAGLAPEWSVQLHVGECSIGYLGSVDQKLAKRLKLPAETSVAELSLPALCAGAILVPQFYKISQYPSIARDLNLIVAEAVQWADLEASARSAVGVELAEVRYRETYRAPDKDGEDTKRILFSVELQRGDATLTGEEADLMVQSILKRCERDHGAKLLA